MVYNQASGRLEKEDKEKIFNLATGTWEYRIKAPPLPNMVKDSSEFRAWFKTLTKTQQDAVKSKYF